MPSNTYDLPGELWCVIASKFDSLADRVRFRAVCQSWRSLLPPPRHPPCLIIHENLDSNHLFCLGNRKIYENLFPEIHEGRCVGSKGPWVITLRNDKTIYLTNMFSRVQTRLPEYGTTEQGDSESFTKIVLSSTPNDEANCSAMAIISGRMRMKLAVVRPGGTSWTSVNCADIQDIIFHKQQFYIVQLIPLRLVICDIGDDLRPPKLLRVAHLPRLKYPSTNYCLVECSGEMLLVIKVYHRLRWGFRVYKFDFTDKKFNKLKCLGEHSLFLYSRTTCICVSASDYHGLVRKNCIYFIPPFVGCDHEIQVFDLENKDVSVCSGSIPISSKYNFNIYPVWVAP